jgi:hypothetical protein
MVRRAAAPQGVPRRGRLPCRGVARDPGCGCGVRADRLAGMGAQARDRAGGAGIPRCVCACLGVRRHSQGHRADTSDHPGARCGRVVESCRSAVDGNADGCSLASAGRAVAGGEGGRGTGVGTAGRSTRSVGRDTRLRRPQSGPRPRILLRRHRRGDHQRAVLRARAARRVAHVLVPVQGPCRRRARDRQGARRRCGARGQRTQVGRPGAHQRAAGECR